MIACILLSKPIARHYAISAIGMESWLMSSVCIIFPIGKRRMESGASCRTLLPHCPGANLCRYAYLLSRPIPSLIRHWLSIRSGFPPSNREKIPPICVNIPICRRKNFPNPSRIFAMEISLVSLLRCPVWT